MHRSPLLARREIGVDFQIVRAFRIGAIVGAPQMRYHARHLRIVAQNTANLPLDLLPLIERNTNRHCYGQPNVSLIKRRQKFRAESSRDNESDQERHAG